MEQGRAFVVTFCRVEVETVLLTFFQGNLAILYLADPKLRALEIHQNGNRALYLRFNPADRVDIRPVVGM